MPRYYHPLGSVSAVDTTTVPIPAVPPSQANGSQPDPTDIGIPVQQPSAQTVQTATDQARLQKYMDAALKKTGFKAEITNERNGYTVVKLVQSDTGQVILQMPNQTVLGILADLDQETSRRTGTSTPATGAVIDQLV